MSEIRSETPQLIVFVDLTRFAAQSQRVDDVEIADTLDASTSRSAPPCTARAAA